MCLRDLWISTDVNYYGSLRKDNFHEDRQMWVIQLKGE